VLESAEPHCLPQLKRQFVRVSSMATITHLKKFLAHKVLPMKEKLEEKKREERRKKKEEERVKDKEQEKDKDKSKDETKEQEGEDEDETKKDDVEDLSDKFRDIDITCDGELIPKDHTLKFVYITRWRTKDPPLHLVYSPKIKIAADVEGNGDIPEWKLQPKLSYDDDDDN